MDVISTLMIIGLLLQNVAAYFEIVSSLDEGSSQIIFRIIATFPIFIIILLYAGISKIFKFAVEISPKMLFLFMTCTLFGLITGFVTNALSRYLFADIFRMIMPWLFFWIAAYCVKENFDGKIISGQKILNFIALLSAIDATITIILSMQYWKLRVSTNLHLYGLGWALFNFSRVRYWKRIIVAALCVVAILACGKRGNIVAAPIAIATTFIWQALKNTKTVVKNTRTAMVLVASILLIAIIGEAYSGWYGATDSLHEKYLRTMDRLTLVATSGVDSDASLEERFDEFDIVIQYLKDNPIFIFTGAGFGATAPYYNKNVVRSDLPGRMHQIHIGWIAYLFRNGILGVILYFSFFYVAIYKNIRSAPMEYEGIIMYYTVLALILSLKSNILLEGIGISIVVAMSWSKK